MISFPSSTRDWLIAIVSALVGFFLGGAIVAGVQTGLRKVLP